MAGETEQTSTTSTTPTVDEVKDTKIVEETLDEEEVQDESQDNETGEDDETPSEEDLKVTKQDYALLQLLKDPSTRKQTLAAIAANVGLKVVTGETTQERGQKSVEEILKESLGEDWSFLAPKLGPAFKEAIKQEISELRKEFETAEERRVLQESERATTRMYKKYPDFKNYEKQIAVLIDKVKPEEGIEPFEFLENLYFIAKGRSSQNALAKKTAARIKTNARDAETFSGVSDSNLKSGSKRPTLDEAVKLALQQIREKK